MGRVVLTLAQSIQPNSSLALLGAEAAWSWAKKRLTDIKTGAVPLIDWVNLMFQRNLKAIPRLKFFQVEEERRVWSFVLWKLLPNFLGVDANKKIERNAFFEAMFCPQIEQYLLLLENESLGDWETYFGMLIILIDVWAICYRDKAFPKILQYLRTELQRKKPLWRLVRVLVRAICYSDLDGKISYSKKLMFSVDS